MEIGNQYPLDDTFKSRARLHQSQYRAYQLKVDCGDYGNRLKDKDGESLFNYYDKLNCRTAKQKRYPDYSKKRDADMLRSEHIPFNLIAPLETDLALAKEIVSLAFQIEISEILCITYEYAPTPKEKYLNDSTAFDAYIACRSRDGKLIGIGIEVKYTERAYSIGSTEAKKVKDKESLYWRVTKESKVFKDPDDPALGEDNLRQIWRNHLLGLAMIQRREIDKFYSVTLFPRGNQHFEREIQAYRERLLSPWICTVIPCTYEKFIDCIHGSIEFEEWKEWLTKRYIIC
jgi:hypothetical protein